MSNCSTEYARQISTLLRDFTISSVSLVEDDAQSKSQRPSAAPSPTYESESEDESEPEDECEVFEAFPEPGFALPGDFLRAHERSCADFPGQKHGSGNCWCAIAQQMATDENAWLTKTGELGERARYFLQNPSQENLELKDCFGNSPLHLLASIGKYQKDLVRIVSSSGRNVREANCADQTFLHVLHPVWFENLAGPSAPLYQLLLILKKTAPDLVYETDVYGRSFFHRAHALVRNPNVLSGLMSAYNPALVSQRDAFGLNPMEGAFIPPRRMSSHIDMTAAAASGHPRPPMTESEAIQYHTRLLQVIHASYINPLAEDSEGRNGLHCLAEAALTPKKMDEERSKVSSGRPAKRRMVEVGSGVHSASSSTFIAVPSDPASPTTGIPTDLGSSGNGTETPLLARLRHLEGLLRLQPSASTQSRTPAVARPSQPQPVATTVPMAPTSIINVNHYSKAGLTPLMAFILCIPDNQDDKSLKTLQTLLETLLSHSSTKIEARNYRGETALLFACRLGRKVALLTLLEHGANVYARDGNGRGILEVIDYEVKRQTSEESVPHYARLEACRVLLTGRRDWGLLNTAGATGVLSEWVSRRTGAQLNK